MLSSLSFTHALMLQGPMGPFFHRLAKELESHGKRVTKINLNAGDALYYPGGLAYREGLEQWPRYLRQVISDHGIDAVLLFGDGRPYHQAAIATARELGVQVVVFEEGYVRPDWITFESGGVNANSHMPRDPAFYQSLPAETGERDQTIQVGKSFRFGALHATGYTLALTLFGFLYPQYTHHRSLKAWSEAFYWVRGGARKVLYRHRERPVLEHLVRHHAQKYFLVALQVHCDYQLNHSRFRSVEQFIEHVVASFTAHAEPDQRLVVKHHPMDRPYREYGPLMKRLAESHGLGDRLVYIHDLHLPTLLRHARGSVMINSTVGLQSIDYGIPVKLLGNAVYDMKGLTHQGTLDDFWRHPEPVDQDLYQRFRGYLMRVNQANGSFHKRLRRVATPTGVRWLSVLFGLLAVSLAAGAG